MILTKDIRDVIILLNQYSYGQGKIMKTTFISYSTHNKEIAFRIVEELEKRGLTGLNVILLPAILRPEKIMRAKLLTP